MGNTKILLLVTQGYVKRWPDVKTKVFMGLLVLLFIFQGSFLQVEAKTIDYKSAEFKAVASQFACTCGCGPTAKSFAFGPV